MRARFNRAKDNKNKRDERAAVRAEREFAADMDCRASVVLAHLGNKPTTVRELMKPLGRHKAFRTPDDADFLSGDSLKKAIKRALKICADRGLIATTERTHQTVSRCSWW